MMAVVGGHHGRPVHGIGEELEDWLAPLETILAVSGFSMYPPAVYRLCADF